MAATPPSDPPSTVDAATTRVIEPADLGRLRSVVDVALHPDGRTVVSTIGWPDVDTDSNRSVLEACTVEGDRRRRLTDGHRDRQPRFSPDGRRLAFLRGQPGQPTRVAVAEWPAAIITEVASLLDGADDVRWAGNDRLVVLASQRPADQEGVDDTELARHRRRRRRS